MLLFFTKIIDFSNDDGVMTNGDDDGGFLRMVRRELCVMLLALAALEDAETASMLSIIMGFRCNIQVFFLRVRGGNFTF